MPRRTKPATEMRRKKKKFIKIYPELANIWDLLNPPLFSDDE